MNLAKLPADLLAGRRILLAVTGSISAYKALELLRLYVKTGAQVRVVMSEEAKKFVAPLSFEALCGAPVLHLQTESWTSDVNHIGYAQGCDVLVLAPATANTINKLAAGIADTLVTQCALACTAPLIVAPAANTAMIHHPATDESLRRLQERGAAVVATQNKLLACATVGDGALAEPVEIFWQTARTLLATPDYQGRHIVITGGGTVEKIDDVRYLSNFSSGKTARALAVAAYLAGADVTLISSVGNFNLPCAIAIRPYQSTQELQSALHTTLQDDPRDGTTCLLMAAAVSDYLPAAVAEGKLKKESLGDTWQLHLAKNDDLLASLDKQGLRVIGFKAESDPTAGPDHARRMLRAKHLDAVCLNLVTPEHSPFGADTNAYLLITANGETSLPMSDKLSLARTLIARLPLR